jgi:hypothetical protein
MINTIKNFHKLQEGGAVLKGYKVYGRARAGAGIFVRTDFFFGKNQDKKF